MGETGWPTRQAERGDEARGEAPTPEPSGQQTDQMLSDARAVRSAHNKPKRPGPMRASGQRLQRWAGCSGGVTLKADELGRDGNADNRIDRGAEF